jgi:FkbM family methyltransferase
LRKVEGAKVKLKRKVADAIGKTIGLSIAPIWGMSIRAEEYFVQTMLKALEIDCVFDVGANVGRYGRALRSIGYKGLILSFEPGPEMFSELQASAAGDPLWETFPVALGDQEARLPLNIMKSNVMSSFLQPQDQAGARYSSINVVDRVVEVEVRTLEMEFDKLRARHGFSRPFLKLDTQGFDLHVVRGAGGKLRNFCAILSEVAVRRLYAGSPSMLESLTVFEECGFDVMDIFKVHARELLDPYEFNCYVLRRDLAPSSRAPS